MDRPFFNFHSKLHEFHLFSKAHLLTIGIILVVCVLIFVFRGKIEEKGSRTFFRFFFAILLIVTDTWQQLWLVHENAWRMKTALPLQLSDLVVIVAILMLLFKSHHLFQFVYYAGLGSSIQAILTPDLNRFSFPHFQYIEFFVSHGGVILACLLMIAAFHCRPTVASIWVTFLIVNLYGALVFFFNKSLNANYLYIMKKPESTSLLNFLGPWPWYLISLDIAMIISFYILYLPFWIKGEIDVSEI
ncbi:MAG TPA: TIGR02206 family membrane protein [Candidatus Angelobacter sp.]|nr:TIGR02206 family membrane protein [Candidatus Angelobacter sp.]